MVADKTTIQQVLGCLMKRTQLLSEVDKYSLTVSDFSTKFEKYIFTAIVGLHSQGANTLSPIDIENYLEVNDIAKALFTQQNGLEYLNDIIELSSVDNFPYYYGKLKKINLLRDLSKQGFDVSAFYCDDFTNPKAEEINSRFEKLTTQEICDTVKKKLLHLENEYAQSEEVKVENLSDGFTDFLDELNNEVTIGLPIQGDIYNEVIGGAQPGALTIRSGGSGVGKTRQSVADACYLAYPIRYNTNNHKWEQRGSSEKVLFIVTEQTFKQIRRMVLAYLTDIDDKRFDYGHFTKQEMALIEKAQRIVEKYSDNFVLVKMPNPTIESVKLIVRENCLTKDIGYVFYDYIFIGPSLLNEFKGFNLRNDEVLLMFATALKDLAVELNVAMFTSTQVNANADDNKNIRNEGSLAGGRATINKADNGAIMARPTKDELEILKPTIEKFGMPNCVTDIFKVRSGAWTQVRIWSMVDLARMKKVDLFITDARLDPIENFFSNNSFNVYNWDEEEFEDIADFVKELNGT